MSRKGIRPRHERGKVIPNVADKLKSPPKTGRRLGPSKDTWCEFHQAFHNLRNCLALGHQFNELVSDGFLKEYLEENQEAPVRMDGYKLEGGELFKEDFRKLLKLELIYLKKQLIRNTVYQKQQTKTTEPEKQSVVSKKQSVVYTSRQQTKVNLKS